jgi:hypothetical protein
LQRLVLVQRVVVRDLGNQAFVVALFQSVFLKQRLQRGRELFQRLRRLFRMLQPVLNDGGNRLAKIFLVVALDQLVKGRPLFGRRGLPFGLGLLCLDLLHGLGLFAPGLLCSAQVDSHLPARPRLELQRGVRWPYARG